MIKNSNYEKQKEIDRNNAIYNDYQHNRNPFVDYPEYARMIWDPSWSVTEQPDPNEPKANRIAVFDIMGRKLLQFDIANEDDELLKIKEQLQHGCYIIQ